MVIFDELKSIASTLREADKIPQYEQILNIQEKLLEMQNRIFDLESENRNLKIKLDTKEDMIVKNDAYWTKLDDGPFCMTCHGAEDLIIRMVTWGEGQHKCNHCNNTVETNPGKAEQVRRQQEAEINRRNSFDQYI